MKASELREARWRVMRAARQNAADAERGKEQPPFRTESLCQGAHRLWLGWEATVPLGGPCLHLGAEVQLLPRAWPGLSLGDVPNRQPIGIVLTVLGVVVLDFSADATEGPIRAYLLDVVDSEEQDMALNIHAFSAGESAPLTPAPAARASPGLSEVGGGWARRLPSDPGGRGGRQDPSRASDWSGVGRALPVRAAPCGRQPSGRWEVGGVLSLGGGGSPQSGHLLPVPVPVPLGS